MRFLRQRVVGCTGMMMITYSTIMIIYTMFPRSNSGKVKARAGALEFICPRSDSARHLEICCAKNGRDAILEKPDNQWAARELPEDEIAEHQQAIESAGEALRRWRDQLQSGEAAEGAPEPPPAPAGGAAS
jgi:hypothetical protein